MKWKFDLNDYVHLNPLIQAGFRFVTVKAKDVQNKNLPRSIRGEKIEDCDPEDLSSCIVLSLNLKSTTLNG